MAAHRLKPLVLKNASPQSRAEREVAGYRDAIGLIHESGERMPFSDGTVRRLHSILYRYMPERGGDWKVANNSIVERPSACGASICFHPVATNPTAAAMADLIACYRTVLDQRLADPLVLVPLSTNSAAI